MQPSAESERRPGRLGRAARWLGPLLGLATWALIPGAETAGLDPAGRATAAVAVWMAVWWLGEALPLAATALLPVVVFPLLGVLSPAEAARPYASDIIFLFMGGFMLGLAMERWGLHRRIALRILLLVGTSPRRLVAGFMVATALLSMWISNTAAAIILLPVGLSVVAMLLREGAEVPEREARVFATGLMLAIAYSASIGGSATLIGSPPNLVVASYARERLDCDVTMLSWMRFGVPVMLAFLALAWLYLTRLAFPVRIRRLPQGEAQVRAMLGELGAMARGERVVLGVFSLTAAAWVLRPQLAAWLGVPGLTDAVIGMAGALSLFLIPVGGGRAALDWETAVRLPWGVLVLFGGGLALAAAIGAHGVDGFIASGLYGLAGAPMLLVVFAVTVLVVFATELTSNTAIATALTPVLAAAALGLGVPAMPLLVAIGLGASYAFMLPVATPPNAIVFGSGHVTTGQMARAGIALNIVAVVLVTLAARWAGAGLCSG
ncbi:DASS family sodium-coupled anion symporter [Luteimonas sp. RD2P54]|uniref:DASS family sodium-coupled anion symporter n=1 Tax=Luteimonas endophytica TaxID=3042023 RepID=A0ABT6JC22_9GAMM|nr:DASS family sodium-coupled anion symporter [Luteimonas endophytica]MDH5824373.1 DASS family sodium-coupled anion symporter [Luteimonas endophytica]